MAVIRKPDRLKKGDLIGIISPASAPADLSLIENGINYIEGCGYRTLLGKNVEKVKGYLAGTDQERADDIHQMFSNKNVKAIFCIRGGYGAVRLLDKIDYNLIKRNPKIFVGFSEITSLQMAFFNKARLITFAGPMVASNFAKGISSYTETNFWDTITSPKKLLSFRGSIFKRNSSKIIDGVTGRILGGNLAVFTSLMGTKYFTEVKDGVLFIEEVEEPPYKIDRMFNQLRLNNVFKKVKAIILGSFVDCEEKDEAKKTMSLKQVLADYFQKSDIPVIKSFPHGHIKDFVTIPFGIRIKINGRNGKVKFLESGVM